MYDNNGQIGIVNCKKKLSISRVTLLKFTNDAHNILGENASKACRID